MLHQRKSECVENAESAAALLALGIRHIIVEPRQQPVQFQPVDAQAAGEAAVGAGAVVAHQMFGKREAGVGNDGFVAAIGPAGPIGRVEQLAISRDRFDASEIVRGADEAHQLAGAGAGGDELGDRLGFLARRRAGTCDDVDRIAELLEHGIVRDGADLAQVHIAVGRQVRLAARFAAAGFVEQAEAEGGDGAGVAARGEEVALHPADTAIEIQGEVGARVEGIGFGRQGRAFDLGNAGQHRQRQGVRAERQEAVAALEADLGFERDACCCKAPAGPEAHRIGQTVGDAGWVRAAAHRFAMGVEDQRGGIGQAMRRHRLRQPPVQPFDGERGGDLPDEAAGIGKAGLDGDTPTRLGIIAIGWLTQQRIEKAAAMFHRAFGFEQRRDIDFVLDAEQPREIERSEHGLRLLAFGDQHADRRVAVDMVEDLRHCQELADGCGALYRQRGEVAAQRLHIGKQVAQTVERGTAGEIEAVVGVDAAADGVEQLRAVHPEMDPAHAEAIGTHRGGGGQQADSAVLFRRTGKRFDRCDGSGEAGQPVGMVRGDAIGGGAERGGIVGR